ncbi:BlaI/MecI/CopY family transcriptional regulator [Segeticoccus rhizosphaerae]|uniref:BlaI/MecI/CopY family transcriptional regulator n=1 Tax=Segeticoccus rhizosphaerae TaxID=1104777 RepID=UPI0010C09D25|nr:BlaI/MecI/CopY family transcriptional regulator [Ornithinicoccus soli]
MADSTAPRLGDLERAVMEHLWSRQEAGGGPVTVREVHESLGASRGLAYTTVMTVLDRLAKKGLVVQERTGRAYHYLPAASRESLTARVLRDALGGLERSDRQAAMLHFLDDATADEIDDLRAALAVVEARRPERRSGRG